MPRNWNRTEKRLREDAEREAFRILDNQQTVYDSIRSSDRFNIAGVEDVDLLVIYKASGSLVNATSALQKARMIKLGIVHYDASIDAKNLVLTPLGVKVYKRLEHAFRGTTFDPVWGRVAQAKAKKNMQIMIPKNDAYRKDIDDSIERRKSEASLQSYVKGLRTAWMNRPRISRFTVRAWIYRWKIWIRQTTPEIPMINWSELKLPEWTDEDRKNQRQVWHDSDLLAFWLCPDGIDAGIEAHDKFLRICEKRGFKSVAKRKEVISEITGIPIPKPKQSKVDVKKSKKSAIDEILGHLSALDDEPNQELKIEVHEIGKPSYNTKFVVPVLGRDGVYKTRYFTTSREAEEYAKLVKRKEELDDRRRIYNQKYDYIS